MVEEPVWPLKVSIGPIVLIELLQVKRLYHFITS